MKKRKNYYGVLPALIVVGSLWFTSCADSNYDLGDLDMTIAVGSEDGILLPVCSTQEMILDDILDIDNSDCIDTLNGGNYVFKKIGDDVKPAEPQVDIVNVSKQTSVDMNPIIGPSSKPENFDLVPIGTEFEGTGGTFTKEINTFNYSADKPDDVVELQHAIIEGKVTLNLSFNNDLQQYLTHFTSFNIEFPSYMTLGNPSNGTLIGNTLKLGAIRTDTPISTTIDIQELRFQEISEANRLVIENGKITMLGDVKVTVTYPNPVKKGNGDITKMQINSTTQISTIQIKSATGKFDPKIDINDVGNIDISDVPDFLNDPDVKISLLDPQITLTVNSNVDLDAIIDGTLTSYFKDGKTKSVTIPNILLPRNNNSKILICRQPKTEPYKDFTKVYVVEELSSLIEKIPEKITFKADARADKDAIGTINLGQKYNITTAYNFESLLELMAGSVIVYNDTIDDWNEDLEDITLSKDAEVVVTFDVNNKMDADLQISAIPIDKDNHDISSKISITNATVGANASTKDVMLTIKQKDTDALNVLNGIVIKAVATSTKATPLNARTQTIKLDNIRAMLKGKVVIDDK